MIFLLFMQAKMSCDLMNLVFEFSYCLFQFYPLLIHLLIFLLKRSLRLFSIFEISTQTHAFTVYSKYLFVLESYKLFLIAISRKIWINLLNYLILKWSMSIFFLASSSALLIKLIVLCCYSIYPLTLPFSAFKSSSSLLSLL